MHKKIIVASLLSLGICSFSNQAAAKLQTITVEKQKQPNIVLFFVDDLGWGELGMRNSQFETPNVDALAADALSLEHTYVASPTCSPSRGTLVTGIHPARTKIVRHIPGSPKWGFDKWGRPTEDVSYWPGVPAQFPVPNWLDTKYQTYAEALHHLGYYNHFVGKWHLGHEEYHPDKSGWDSQFGTTNWGHPASYNAWGYKKAPQKHDGAFFHNSDVLKNTPKGAYLTEVLTDHVVDWLKSYDQKKPFMLSFWLYNVHRPADGKAEYVEHFKAKGLTADKAQYAAQIKSMDESFGRVRAALDDAGLTENTVILFTSDQGSYYGNPPFRGSKRKETLYEGGSRVPMFVYWPGVTGSGVKTDALVQTTDIFPTLVEIAGANAKDYKQLDGVSWLPLIKGAAEINRGKPIFGYRAYQDLYISIREGEWKMLGHRSGELHLFNMLKDPTESNDVAAQFPEVVAEMKKKIMNWEKEVGVEQYSGFIK